MLYRNPATNRGEMLQLSFMADETAHSFTFALSGFEFILNHNPAVILIDKVSLTNQLKTRFLKIRPFDKYICGFNEDQNMNFLSEWSSHGDKTFLVTVVDGLLFVSSKQHWDCEDSISNLYFEVLITGE